MINNLKGADRKTSYQRRVNEKECKKQYFKYYPKYDKYGKNDVLFIFISEICKYFKPKDFC